PSWSCSSPTWPTRPPTPSTRPSATGRSPTTRRSPSPDPRRHRRPGPRRPNPMIQPAPVTTAPAGVTTSSPRGRRGQGDAVVTHVEVTADDVLEPAQHLRIRQRGPQPADEVRTVLRRDVHPLVLALLGGEGRQEELADPRLAVA